MFENNVQPKGYNPISDDFGYNPIYSEAAKEICSSYTQNKQAELKTEEELSRQFWDTVRESNIQFNQTAQTAINQGTQGQGNTIVINQPNNIYYAPKKDNSSDVLAGLLALVVGIFIGKRI